MSSTPTTQGIRYARDYAIESLTLLSATFALDVKNIMIELSYNEDLFNNVASGYLMVTDAMGYIEVLELTGNEFLRMTFSKTANDSSIIDKIFRVYKVAKRELVNNMNTESYCLYFTSEETILNEQHKVCRAYPGQLITDNIIDILRQDLKVPSNKLNPANFETTYGRYDFVIPNIKPFDAINWMSIYARPSDNNPGSDMLMFENKFGFNFKSLQSLLDTSKNKIYNYYTYNPKNMSSVDIMGDALNVTTYEIMNSYDSLGAINSGIFANRLLSIDILSRTKKITDFDYSNYNGKLGAKKLNEYNISNNFTNRYGEGMNDTPQAVFKMVFSNFGQKKLPYVKEQGDTAVANDIYAETYIPYRTAQLALSNYTRLKISLPGDSSLTVGMNISFDLLSLNPDKTKKARDPYYSGNYLVTGVRHMITMQEYKTILEICKESVTRPYSSPDNESVVWSNTVKGILSEENNFGNGVVGVIE